MATGSSGGGGGVGELRSLAALFVASGPSGVAVRTRLKQLTPDDGKVLRLVGGHLGSLASKDLKARCQDGFAHSGDTWAVRKRELTPLSSSRWAGSITKKAPGGYRFQREWHAKSRRLRVLQDQPAAVRADREAGLVHVVRGGKRLARARHHWMRPR